MHIVLANRWYPPHTGYGGVAMYNYYLAHALVDLGHKVTIVAARWSRGVPAVSDDRGVTVHRLFAPPLSRLQRVPKVGKYVKPVLQLMHSLRIARKLREFDVVDKPEVVEFTEVEAEGFIYVRMRQRSRVIVRCQTPWFVLQRYYSPHEVPYNTSLTFFMEEECIRKADLLTAPSHDMACTIADHCGLSQQKFIVFPNAIDLSLFSAASPDTYNINHNGGSSDDCTVLHVGRLDRAKGIEHLMHAIPLVLREAPNTRFVFVGADRPDGCGATWRQRLEAFARSHGISEKVVFLGDLDQASLFDWYHRSDIAVIPSILYESFSYTCAQAMAAGLPVVASRIGGIPETIDDEVSGLLTEPGNVQDLVQAIVRLSKDRQLRTKMGSAGKAKAARAFDAYVIAKRYLELIEGNQPRYA